MTFDAERVVSAMLRLADVSTGIERSKNLMSENLNNPEVGAKCLSAIQDDIRKAYEALPELIDAVSHDTVGSRGGGLNELLVRAIRLVAMYDQSALLLSARQHTNIKWCVLAPEMLRPLACEVLWVTADMKYGKEPLECARHSFARLQRLGVMPLGGWLLDGMQITAAPEINASCKRLWIVLNIGNRNRGDSSNSIAAIRLPAI